MRKSLALLLGVLLALSLLSGCGAPQAAEPQQPLSIIDDSSASLPITDEPASEPETPQIPILPEEPEEPLTILPDDGEETSYTSVPDTDYTSETASTDLEEDGVYTSAEDVALYLHTYNHLPDNFITKDEARALGWSGGSLEPYAPGMCIGGDWFGNYEGLLPRARGRTYSECDINTLGARSRGAERIIWSNDGLIYYTDDHYESFTLLYGTP